MRKAYIWKSKIYRDLSFLEKKPKRIIIRKNIKTCVLIINGFNFNRFEKILGKNFPIVIIKIILEEYKKYKYIQ